MGVTRHTGNITAKASDGSTVTVCRMFEHDPHAEPETLVEHLETAAAEGFSGALITDMSDEGTPDVDLEPGPVLNAAGKEAFADVLRLPAERGSGMFGDYIEVKCGHDKALHDKVVQLALLLSGYCTEEEHAMYAGPEA